MQITLCFWLFKNSQLWTCFPALLQLQSVEEITSALRILFSAAHDAFQTLDWAYPICFWVVQFSKTLAVACAPQSYKKVFWITPGADHYLKCRPSNIYFTANISDFLKSSQENWKDVLEELDSVGLPYHICKVEKEYQEAWKTSFCKFSF